MLKYALSDFNRKIMRFKNIYKTGFAKAGIKGIYVFFNDI